jgi:hypothetical protein
MPKLADLLKRDFTDLLDLAMELDFSADRIVAYRRQRDRAAGVRNTKALGQIHRCLAVEVGGALVASIPNS